MNSHEVFIHIHQGCFAGIGAIVRLPQCQWSKPDGYGKISQCITATKHSKAKTVCIFLGIYCKTESRVLGLITVMGGIYVTWTSLDLLSSTVALPNPDRLRPAGKYLSSSVSERKLPRNRYDIAIFGWYKLLMKRNMILCNICMFEIKVQNHFKSAISDNKIILIIHLLKYNHLKNLSHTDDSSSYFRAVIIINNCSILFCIYWNWYSAKLVI